MSITLSIRPTFAECSALATDASSNESSDNESPDNESPDNESPEEASLTQSPPLPPSNRQVTDHLDALFKTTLSLKLLSDALRCFVAQLSSTQQLHGQLAQSVTEAMIAEQYAQTAISLWQLAQAEYLHQAPTQPLLEYSFAKQQFIQQLNDLCLLWAMGKWQQPNHPFFVPSATAFATLQSKWQHPVIQSSLSEITLKLLYDPEERWMGLHLDSWAYLLGVLMHQLLQWNHQLTPQYLRELLQINEGKPDDSSPETC